MEDVMLIGLSRQMALQRTMDVIANNLANLNTTGFKSEKVLFEEYLMPVEGTDGSDPDDLSYVIDFGTAQDYSDGRIEHTGAPLDLALTGEGFLTVETPDGPRYTRNGHLMLDQDGFLATVDGYKVLASDQRPIQVNTQGAPFNVAQNGGFIDAEGSFRSLAIAGFQNLNALERVGNGLMKTDEVPVPVTGTRVVQGALEQSNVVAVTEMTHMIDVLRAYQASARLGQTTDDLTKEAIERLGSTTNN